MRIMMDLDGVVYDFTRSLAEYIHDVDGRVFSPVPSCWSFYEVDWGMPVDEFLRFCHDGVNAGYVFAYGDPIPGSMEALNWLKDAGHTIHLITDRHYGSRAKSNTEIWLNQWSVPCDSLSFSVDKTIMRCDMGLDDRPKNVDAMRSVGIEAYLFDCGRTDQAGHPYMVKGWDEFLGKVESRGPGLVVGLAGRARSGKDTIGNMLVERYGFRRLAFADNVKRATLALDPKITNTSRVSDVLDDMGGWEQAKMVPEVRRLLQLMGTEAGREIHGPNLWVDAIRPELCSSVQPAVITDVRFPNEAAAIKQMGGVVVRLSRKEGGLIVGDNSHASEALVDGLDVDLDVSNDGTPGEAVERITDFVALRMMMV